MPNNTVFKHGYKALLNNNIIKHCPITLLHGISYNYIYKVLYSVNVNKT